METYVKFFPFYIYIGAASYVIRSLDEWIEFKEGRGMDNEELKKFIRIKYRGGDFVFGIGFNYDGEITLHEWAKKKNPEMFKD